MWGVVKMRPISVYPPVVEDLAFVVDETVSARQVRDAIVQGGGDLVVAVDLFDVYRGDPLPPGKKSLAFRVTYQSLEKSLSEKDVRRLRERIVRTVERETGGKLRAG